MKKHFCYSTILVVCALLFSFMPMPVLSQACPDVFYREGFFATSECPVDIVALDADMDGNLDLATANFFSTAQRDISLLLGNGDGTFRPAVHFNVGISNDAIALTAADFNSDNAKDLVVVLENSGAVGIMMGDGMGSFNWTETYTVRARPESAAVGYLDQNSIPDIAVANSGSLGPDGISLLYGNGDGTFQEPAVSIPTGGSGPYAILVADLNGDTSDDIAVTNSVSGNVAVLLADVAGGFKPPVLYQSGAEPLAIALADTNGDTIPDIITGNHKALPDGAIAVFHGNGDGTFQDAIYSRCSAPPQRITVVSLNGDASPDLVVAGFDSDEIVILYGNGDGTFREGPVYGAWTLPSGVVVADFASDGTKDLAIALSGTDEVEIAKGLGGGRFETKYTNHSDGVPIYYVAGMFDGDSNPDLAVVNNAEGTVSILLGQGDGRFSPSGTVTVGGAANSLPTSAAAGLINGDSFLDLVVNNSRFDSASILTGSGDGNFQETGFVSLGSNPQQVILADFDSDFAPDIAAADQGSGDVAVLLGNGDGTFVAARFFATGGTPIALAAGLFNSDGAPDLVAVNFLEDTIAILLGNGDGTFQQPAVTYPAGGTAPRAAAVGRFNADSFLDILVTNTATDTVSLLLGNGDGTFQPAVTFPVGRRPRSAAIDDFDGDGFQDAAVLNYDDGTVSLLRGDGNGSFSVQDVYRAGLAVQHAVSSDFDSDGRPDLAVCEFRSDVPRVVTLLNNCGAVSQTASVLSNHMTNPSDAVEKLQKLPLVSANADRSVPVSVPGTLTDSNVLGDPTRPLIFYRVLGANDTYLGNILRAKKNSAQNGVDLFF
jgi:hypothetical protein